MNNIKINKNLVLNILFTLILVLGVFLRLYFYFVNSTFEEDECRLALAVLDSKNLFLPLLCAQSAPPLFTLATKFLTSVFGQSEYIYRLIPLISSFLSLIFFYKLCKKYLKSELAIFLGFFIFSINIRVVQFSYIFKQYSPDLLIGILCLYYLPQFKLKDMSTKHQVILTSVLCLLPFFSLTSVFFIGAFFFLNINKKLFYTIIPFSALMGIYYYFNLHPSSMNMNDIYPHYWDNGYIGWNFKNFIALICSHLKFLFAPNKYILCQIILLLIGIISSFKDRKFDLMLLSLCLIIAASVLQVYPFYGRTALFTISIFLILILNAFSIESKKIFITSIILFIIGFYNYITYIKEYKYAILSTHAPKTLLNIIKEYYDPQKDTVLLNIASEPSFAYYAIEAGFNQFNFEILEAKMETLPKNKYYWVYLIKDYSKDPIFQRTFTWARKQTVLFYHREKNSFLIYLKT